MANNLAPLDPPPKSPFKVGTTLKAVPDSQKLAPIRLMAPEGQIRVHTASFRGSFNGVLSEALRAAGLGSRVMVAQFLKGGVNQGPEGIIKLCGRLEWIRPNISSCINEPFEKKPENHISLEIAQAIQNIWQTCRKRILKGELDQLVLDEVGLATTLGYLDEEELISTLNSKPSSMDLILTGPSIPTRIIEIADQITQTRSF
tara:strand:- start:390 stop:995 length:606 start_codon:yes stop_codon:yes gene_type:complete